MNILFLSRDYPPNLIGGVGIYVYEISRHLVKIGHRVFVIAESIEQPFDNVEQGVHIFRVKLKKNRIFNTVRGRLSGFVERLEYSYAVSKKMEEVVSKYKIDIVESCEARAEGFWYYLFRKNPPLVIKLHTPESIVFKLNQVCRTLDYKWINKLEEWWISRANRLIGLSQAIVDLTSRYFRIKLNNLPIVPNPIDIEIFSPNPAIKKNEFSVLYVGRLEFRKGVHLLIKAIPQVLKKIPQAKFTFIGNDCGMKSFLLNKVSELEIRNHVEFIDQLPRDRLIEYYQQSSLCVIPSIWENHPYVILEAMACGKPVIACDIGGISEIIKNRINGILVPAGSFITLAETIIELLSDGESQERLGNNARKYIEENYEPKKVIEKTLKVYEGLLN